MLIFRKGQGGQLVSDSMKPMDFQESMGFFREGLVAMPRLLTFSPPQIAPQRETGR